MTGSPTPTRREFQVLLALVLLGGGLRLRSFGRLGLTHFDEGIYALAGLWSAMPGGLATLDPMVIPYATPGFPILVGLSYSLFGVADVAAIFASAACGVATIPVAYWVGRRTFGPGAGAAVAALASVSLMHVAFSRKALTDAPFLLVWLAAIGLGGRFLDAPRLGRAAVLGLMVGLAQNVKYNGWLAGAIVAASAVVGALVRPQERRAAALARTFGFGAIAAGVALLLYLPWFLFVEHHGGYASLVQHHRGYLGGAGGWTRNLAQQLAQVVALSGGPFWGAGSWGMAWLGAVLATIGIVPTDSGSGRGRSRFLLALCGGAALLAGIANLAWWAGLALLPRMLGSARPAERTLGLWWLSLSILTPFYHPYARLWLPLTAAGWIVLGGAIARLEASGRLEERESRSTSRLEIAGIVACVALGFGQQLAADPRALPARAHFEATDTFRTAVTQAVKGPDADRRELHVLARRPAVFYLLTAGRRPFRLHPDIAALVGSTRPGDWALVDDAVIVQEGGLTAARARFRGWMRRGEWGEPLDPVTLLDVDPRAAYGPSPLGRLSLRLLVRSPDAP